MMVRSLKILSLSFLTAFLLAGFNNCSEVGFDAGSDGTLRKIDNNIVDTNDIDGTELNDENIEQIEEEITQLVEEELEEGEGPSDGDDPIDPDNPPVAEEEDGDEEEEEERVVRRPRERPGKECKHKEREEREPRERERVNYDDFECPRGGGNRAVASSEEEVEEFREEYRNFKVVICKVPPGNPANEHEICPSVNSLRAHLSSGSYIGVCDSNR